MERIGGEEEATSTQSVKVCPLCGYLGSEATCPLDGEVMVASAKNESPTVPMELEDGLPIPAPGYGEWPEPNLPDERSWSLNGQTLDGRFEVGEELGRGGMGRVYEAFQPAVQRSVAIKVLSRGFSENPDAVKRFHREALAASRLSHPNTIRIHDFGESDGWLYMVMERLQGRDLAETLKSEGPFSAKRVVAIAQQVARALEAAHEQGVIHRDLKPANVFLGTVNDSPDFVKVLDFGVAKIVTEGADATQMTQAGAFFGTPQYMAPEQASDEPIDARADVYALGVLMYEMCVGRPPFVGDNPLHVMLAQSRDTPPRLASIFSDFAGPPELESVIFQALAKTKEDRQETITLLAQQLDELSRRLDNPSEPDSTQSVLPPIRTLYGNASAQIQGADATLVGDSKQRWIWPGLALATALALWFTQSPSLTEPTVPLREAAPATSPTIQDPAPLMPKAEFRINSTPAGADVVNADSGAVMGRTPVTFTVGEVTNYRVLKDGYLVQDITLNPRDSERVFLYTLKPKPKPKPRPKSIKKAEVPRAKSVVSPPISPKRKDPPQVLTPQAEKAPNIDDPLEME